MIARGLTFKLNFVGKIWWKSLHDVLWKAYQHFLFNIFRLDSWKLFPTQLFIGIGAVCSTACGLFSDIQMANAPARRKIYERDAPRRTKWESLFDHYFTSCSSRFWLYGLIRLDCGEGEGWWGQSNDRLTERSTEIEGMCACTRERQRFRANAEERRERGLLSRCVGATRSPRTHR